MSQVVKIAASGAQLAEIERLLALPETVLSSTRCRLLRTLRELICGGTVTEILQRSGMGRMGLQKLRIKIELGGLSAVLTKLRLALAKRSAAAAAPRKSRGAPGAQTLRGTISMKLLQAEPVVALASLFLSGDAEVAVFAVQAPAPAHKTKSKEEGDDQTGDPEAVTASELLKSVVKICRDPLPPQWTRGWIDEWVRLPFLFLPRGGELDGMARAASLKPAPLPARFQNHWRFVFLTRGQAEPVRRVVDGFAAGESAVLIPITSGTFVSRLEAVCYTLRVTLNYRGMLPALEGLLDSAANWRGNHRRLMAFAWHSTERKTLAAVRDRVVDFQFRAAGGYLLEVTSYAQRTIPARERFRLFTPGRKPKIEVLKTTDPVPDGSILDYASLLEYNMPFGLEPKRSPEEIKKLLVRFPQTSSFEYAVRLGHDQRPWLRFPDELLHLKKNEVPEHPEIGVVSLPRQFFFPGPSHPALHFNELEHQPDWVIHLRSEGLPALGFHSKRLLTAIWSAFERNVYGDRIAQINGSDAWWRRLLSGPTTSFTIGGEPINDFGRNGLLFDPPYYFSNAELTGRQVGGETSRRLKSCVRPEYAITPEGLERRSEDLSYPGYRAQQTFESMLITFDADFLLRGVSDRAWRLLKEQVQQWTSRIHEVIRDYYFPAGVADNQKILNTVRQEFRGSAWWFSDRLDGWAAEALDDFESAGRVLRRALENMQRLRLCGQASHPFAVLTHKEILKNWKSFLGRTIRGRVVEASPAGATRIDPASLGQADGSLMEVEEANRVDRLLQAVWMSGTDLKKLSEFAFLASEAPFEAWLYGVRQLRELKRPEEFVKGVMAAVEVSRQRQSDGVNVLPRLRKILDAARRR